MTTEQMLAAFELMIEYGHDNPSAEQIATRQRYRRIIKSHYHMSRQPTGLEIQEEVTNLRRKHAAGTMDDRQERLAARLDLF